VKLLGKTLIIIGVTVITLIGLLYIALDTIAFNGVAQMEDKTTRQNIDRLRDALSHEISDMDRTAFDWAVWDDTYVFVQDANIEYVNSNLVDETFINLRLNFMLFFNSSNNLSLVRRSIS